MGCATRVSVFGVSDQVIPKPAWSATETSKNSEISLLASFDKVNSQGTEQTAVCIFIVRKPPKTSFSRVEAHISEEVLDKHSTSLYALK